MIEFAVLASGSKGNCTYFKAGEQRFLIDSGLSCKKIVLRLEELGIDPHSINGIFVTHEHSDHIQSVHTFSYKYKAVVYCTLGTFNSGGLNEKKLHDFVEIESGKILSLEADLKIFPCPIPHDAADPVCYIIHYNGLKFSHVTDLGYSTELVLRSCKGSDGFVIEFNHDPQMLKMGNYPWPLKQRILSRSGHLSNSAATELIESACDFNTKHVVLAHLSEDNNHPDIALMTLKHKLNGNSASLTVAKQNTPTQIFKIVKK